MATSAPPDKELIFSHGKTRLNSEQYSVVTSSPNQNQRILAGAGSGKTTTITARIAYLIEYYHIPAKNILLATFSRAAAEEMQLRVARLCGTTNIVAGTFHAIAARVLKDFEPESVRDQPFVDEFPTRLLTWMKTPRGQKWASKFRIVIVDEVQDINEIQWNIIHTFYKDNESCCLSIVGDDAQNIYTWRGSSIDFLFNFHKHVANCRDYQLRMNYRSSESIVRVANSVMRFIPTLPFKERMVAGRIASLPQRPHVHFFYRASDETRWTAEQVARIYKESTRATIAVLARNNSSLFKVEEQLHKLGLLYNLYTKYNPDRSRTHFRRITLATIHASKGLEWDHVFIMNCHDDCLPSRKGDEDLIAERRLFYVAVTRARDFLTFTYSRHEPSISRFIREIPRPFLIYHGISLYKLSNQEQGQSLLSLSDRVGSLDGAEWQLLREGGAVPIVTHQFFHTHSLYNFSQFYDTPEWVKLADCRETWNEMVKWSIKREIALQTDNLPQLLTADVMETLLTIRIYREDMAFWETHETELIYLIKTFLGYRGEPNIPAVEFYALEHFIKNESPHLFEKSSWTTRDIAEATVILAKVRGQLRPLRSAGYDLQDFQFGYVRNSVPTEYRPQVLASWKRVTDASQPTQEILPDLWNLAALSQVREGRNIPLYQLNEIRENLVSQESYTFCQAIRQSVGRLLIQSQATLNQVIEPEEYGSYIPFSFDCILNDGDNSPSRIIRIISRSENTSPSQEEFLVTSLATFLYEVKVGPVKSMNFFNVISGILTEIPWTETLKLSMKLFWNFLG
ncbi:MAG: ATP-dependent helicase [Actinobacteria bacterium]|nr:ATP-dependent helicase [Actinomycetota bacterium]